MAYVDYAFSISDEDDLVDGAIGDPRGVPIKDIAFAVALLSFEALGAISGLLMTINRVGGDRTHDQSKPVILTHYSSLLPPPLPLPLSSHSRSSSLL
jgi:hypothetical protein